MEELSAFFRWCAAFVGITETPDPEAKGAFIREAEQFTKVTYSGIAGIWNLDEPIDVVIAGHLRKLTAIATSASPTWNGEPMAHVLGMGWIRQERCSFPHPEDYVNAGDIRPAELMREIASA